MSRPQPLGAGHGPRASIRRTALALSAAFVLGGGASIGCKAVEQARAKRRCDQDRLAALATELDANEPDARVMMVSEGLLEACGDELYPTVHRILTQVAKPDADESPSGLAEDQAYRAELERICSAHAQIGETMSRVPRHQQGQAIVELCGFARYELLDEAELRELGGHALFVWVTHEFLLESGTPPEVAKTISRALIRLYDVVLDSALLIDPLDGQELLAIPAAAPLRAGPVIYISRSEMVFNEEQLASLDRGRLDPGVVHGHVIMPLYEKLQEEGKKAELVRAARGEAEDERVAVLVVDGGVTFASVVDTMYTAHRLEYEHFDFVVEPIYPIRRALRIDPPKFAVLGDIPEEEPPMPGQAPPEPPPRPERPVAFKVLILEHGYRVYWGQDEPLVLPKLDAKGQGPDAWDREGLATLAREQTAANPTLARAVISAENAITMDVVLATYATLLGPDCKQHEDGAGCLLPELTLEAGAG